MPLTEFQKKICRQLAQARIDRGEGYLAGGAALNEWLAAPRQSRDVDVFHDSQSALSSTWAADRQLLEQAGYTVQPIRERPAFVEAIVTRGGDSVVFQWLQDSAYRFFPLVTHPDLGLVLHPFDLATNKVLALVGRVEARDWVDILACGRILQPLGLLMWAASGKDLGLSPGFILTEARRSARYTPAEVALLAFEGTPPDFAVLSADWRRMLQEAQHMLDQLPEDTAGACVCRRDGNLFTGGPAALQVALAHDELIFHRGSIKGAWPQVVDTFPKCPAAITLPAADDRRWS